MPLNWTEVPLPTVGQRGDRTVCIVSRVTGRAMCSEAAESRRLSNLTLCPEEARKTMVSSVRDNSCFSYASDVLVYFDAGRLGAVFGKLLDDGNLEMVVFREEDVLR